MKHCCCLQEAQRRNKMKPWSNMCYLQTEKRTKCKCCQLKGLEFSREGNLTSAKVQFSRWVVSDSSQPHEWHHARPPCPSPTPGVYSNSRPSSRWCHPTISSSVVPFSSCPQSLPASESFPTSQLFAWGGQSTGVSALASVLPKKSQDWSPSECRQSNVIHGPDQVSSHALH